MLEPVQSLYYSGRKSLIFCDLLLIYFNVNRATVLENQRFLARPNAL